MIINGEKFACQSCVKGHRVSNCNHHDRPLQPIAPKGRPVKQCEHCRDARKAKSHHTKCDCGSKRPRDKDKTKGESKSEDRSCCCHKGGKCVCGNKAEAADLRLETSLSRPTVAVKSKPKLISFNSENAITGLSSGPYRPHHKHNNSAQISGQPYTIPRLHTLHGTGGFNQTTRKNSVGFGHTVDDMALLDKTETDSLFANAADAPDFDEDSNVPHTALGVQYHDWDNYLNQANNMSTENGSEVFVQAPSFTVGGLYDTTWNAVTDTPVDFTASPNFNPTRDNAFLPADLPLASNPANPDYVNYVQPISNSGESGFQSVPGMTTASSNPQSEMGDAHNLATEFDTSNRWNDSSSANQNGNMHSLDPGSMFSDFRFPGPASSKYRPTPRHMQSYSIDSSVSAQSDRISESSTICPTSGTASQADLQGINAGHLENLATLRDSLRLTDPFADYTTAAAVSNFTATSNYQTSADFISSGYGQTNGHDFDTDHSTTSQAIMIPAGVDDDVQEFSWSYSRTEPEMISSASTASITIPAGLSHDEREYGWLQ